MVIVSLHVCVFHPSLRCNLNCPDCYSASNFSAPQMSLREACLALDKMRDNGVRTLIFSGGEPLLYEHIWDVLSYADDLGFSINMMTNGTLLDSEAANRLASYDFPFWISMDYANEKSQRAWRRGGSFRNIFSFIEGRLAGYTNVGIRSTVFWNNVGDIETIARFCHNRGLPMVAVRVINCKLNKTWREPSQSDVMGLYKLFARWKLDFEDPPFYLYKTRSLDDVFISQDCRVCEAHFHRVSVYPRGDVFPCPFLNSKGLRYGNIFEDDWSVIHRRHQVFNRKLRDAGDCGDHCWFNRQPYDESDERYRYVKGCGGGCIARSYWRYARSHGDLLSIDELDKLRLFDPYCPFYGRAS